MSILACQHCDQFYDTDFEEYCPRCVNDLKDFDDTVHAELTHGDECCYCGREVVDPRVIDERELAKAEWVINRRYPVESIPSSLVRKTL